MVCGYATDETIQNPAPIDFQVLSLEMKLKTFITMCQGAIDPAVEKFPGVDQESSTLRTSFIRTALVNAMRRTVKEMAAMVPGIEATDVSLLTLYVKNGPLDGLLLNMRSDNWPSSSEFFNRVRALNPCPSYRLDGEIEKPHLVH